VDRGVYMVEKKEKEKRKSTGSSEEDSVGILSIATLLQKGVGKKKCRERKGWLVGFQMVEKENGGVGHCTQKFRQRRKENSKRGPGSFEALGKKEGQKKKRNGF